MKIDIVKCPFCGAEFEAHTDWIDIASVVIEIREKIESFIKSQKKGGRKK